MGLFDFLHKKQPVVVTEARVVRNARPNYKEYQRVYQTEYRKRPENKARQYEYLKEYREAGRFAGDVVYLEPFRVREVNRERQARFREAHPDYFKTYRSRDEQFAYRKKYYARPEVKERQREYLAGYQKEYRKPESAFARDVKTMEAESVVDKGPLVVGSARVDEVVGLPRQTLAEEAESEYMAEDVAELELYVPGVRKSIRDYPAPMTRVEQ